MPLPDIRKPSEPDMSRVTLKLETDVLTWFRATGRGYQSRINRVLKWYIEEIEKQDGMTDSRCEPEQLPVVK